MTLAPRKFTKRDITPLYARFETEEDALLWAGAALSWPLQRRAFINLLKQDGGYSASREVWAVDLDQDMVGHFQIVFNRRLRTAGLGRIALDPKIRGQGYGSQMMRIVLDRAFSPAWVHRVDLNVYAHNARAVSLYKAAGFTLEGTRRETTPIGDAIWDTHMMSILRPEFDKRTEGE